MVRQFGGSTVRRFGGSSAAEQLYRRTAEPEAG